jgi:predicted amidohydrolase
MTKHVLIALWSHRSDWCYGTKAPAIIPGLEYMLQQTASALQNLPNTVVETQNAFQAIFVAPEYLFVGQRSTRRRAAMRESSKDRLLSSLQSLSKAYPNILIIAGTAFWREDLDTVEKQDRYNANALGAYLKTRHFGRDTKLTRPEAVVLNGRTNSDTGKTIPGLGDLIGKTPEYRAYNTMFAFLGGDLAFKYNKACDFYETDGANPEKITYIPGLSGGVREVANFKFGVEICFDHGNNTLRGKKADFHIVVSDSTYTYPEQNIGTYLLHASTDYKETGVWQSGSGNRLPAVNNMVPNNNTLSYWLCPIAARP